MNCRIKFEDFAKGRGMRLDKFSDGTYQDKDTLNAYIGWVAAWDFLGGNY